MLKFPSLLIFTLAIALTTGANNALAGAEYFSQYKPGSLQCRALFRGTPSIPVREREELSGLYRVEQAMPYASLLVGTEVIFHTLPVTLERWLVNEANLREAMLDGGVGERGTLLALSKDHVELKLVNGEVKKVNLAELSEYPNAGLVGAFLQPLKLTHHAATSFESKRKQKMMSYPPLLVLSERPLWNKEIVGQEVVVYTEVTHERSEHFVNSQLREKMIEGQIGLRGRLEGLDTTKLTLLQADGELVTMDLAAASARAHTETYIQPLNRKLSLIERVKLLLKK